MNKENSTPRITMQTIQEYVFSVFNLERGLGFTMWQLTIRPGVAIREFLFYGKEGDESACFYQHLSHHKNFARRH